MNRVLLIGACVAFAGCGPRDERAAYSVQACIEKLKDADPKVRYTATDVLKSYGPEAASAVPALTEALKDSDAIVRLGAAYALAEIGPDATSAIPALKATLQDDDDEVRKAVKYALNQLQKYELMEGRGN